jgi:uncharacterized cofD-like protein
MAHLAGWFRWLLPGLGVKRWILLVAVGVALLVNGADRWLVAEGVHFHVNEVIDGIIDDYFSPSYLTWIFMLLGLALVIAGMTMWLRALRRAGTVRGKDRLVDALVDLRLRHGYKIVAIGGGSGLSTLLRGLKRRTSNLTAVVTVTDDGGSSGRLQRELGVLPPGDVRNCLVALADDEAMVTELFQYRFQEGAGLTGHSFGNLFLAALTGITGNFDEAIKASSSVLNIVGRVLPSTLAEARLQARLKDGTILQGESNIGRAQTPIARVSMDPPYAAPLDEVLQAIREADAIVLGPGSLYTSILPNFLVDRVAREVAGSNAVKLYVCNIMTQPGETAGMSASEHISALLDNAGERVCDYAIVNDEPPQRLLAAYAEEGQTPVKTDIAEIKSLGVVPLQAQMITETDTVRHDPEKLASVVVATIDRLIAQRATFMKPAKAYERLPSPANPA